MFLMRSGSTHSNGVLNKNVVVCNYYQKNVDVAYYFLLICWVIFSQSNDKQDLVCDYRDKQMFENQLQRNKLSHR